MIKNVIFDLGNVLLGFRPSEYLEKNKYPDNLKKTILADIFNSREWLMLDNGDINIDDAIEAISLRSSLKKLEIVRIFNLRREILVPVDSNLKMLPELKEHGFRLYFLSNFPADLWYEVKNKYSFFKEFDGGLISAEVKVSKPDIRIFRILLEKYSLNPEECFFIDDIEANVRSAETIGIKGLFTNGSEVISGEMRKALGI